LPRLSSTPRKVPVVSEFVKAVAVALQPRGVTAVTNPDFPNSLLWSLPLPNAVVVYYTLATAPANPTLSQPALCGSRSGLIRSRDRILEQYVLEAKSDLLACVPPLVTAAACPILLRAPFKNRRQMEVRVLPG
jgi:hypothetical protein